MIDIKWIRDNLEKFDQQLAMRGIDSMSSIIANLDKQKRENITTTQKLQQEKNAKSKQLSHFQDKGSEEFQSIAKEVQTINQAIVQIESNDNTTKELSHLLSNLPNILMSEVPYGTDETMNKLVKSWGNPRNHDGCLEHFEIGHNLGMMDFEQTAKISGSRFVTLKADLAKLERALVNFMIDIHTKEFGFLEVSPPYLVRPNAMYNVGQLPKFDQDSFETTTNYRLIPTAEVSLTNMVEDSILPRESLPIRYVAHTPCFRSEAGSSGKDTKGMFRVHQFSKVEMVIITTPDESAQEHEYMLQCAEVLLQRLELPYRVMLLCSGDTGFSSSKTYDIEVWLPGQNKYREISSCSNCTDFQARRMNARYKEFGSSANTFVHTLNGSGLPIGRTIIAILENYQNSDGSVTIPNGLVDYMDGMTKITPI
jgi:seryl-tRNA synthetase